MQIIEKNVVNKLFFTRISVDGFFIIALIIISPFVLIFFSAYLSLCERLFQLCHVLHAATLMTICSFFESVSVKPQTADCGLQTADQG